MKVSDITDKVISYCLFSLAIASAILCVAGVCMLLHCSVELLAVV